MLIVHDNVLYHAQKRKASCYESAYLLQRNPPSTSVMFWTDKISIDRTGIDSRSLPNVMQCPTKVLHEFSNKFYANDCNHLRYDLFWNLGLHSRDTPCAIVLEMLRNILQRTGNSFYLLFG